MLSQFLPPTLTQAIGWTLLHSLWQGALIAFVLGILLVIMNRRSAQARYFVTAAALLTFLVAAAVTFCTLYFAGRTQTIAVSARQTQPVMLQMPLPSNPAATAPSADLDFSDLNFSNVINGYVGQHSPLIVVLWLTGMLVLMLRFAGGLAYVQRLKTYRAAAIPDEWQAKAIALSRKIGLRRSVSVLESALVKVPVAIGYFKPVVLLPIGTFTGLPPQQVEAVLAHELAHIMRNDYWANMLQSLVEIVFFYHPAVWWMSGMVRREREHCCDDIAVQTCGDSLTFVQALAQLGAMQSAPRLALAVSGGKNSLLARIQRLLQPAPQKPTFGEGFIAAGVLFLCLTAVSASAFANLNAPDPVQTTPQNSILEKRKTSDSVRVSGKITSYSTFTDTNKVIRELIIVKDRKGKVMEVSVDGKKLSKAELKNYQLVVAQKLKETEKNADNEKDAGENEEVIRNMETDAEINTQMNTDINIPPFAPLPPLPPIMNQLFAPLPPLPPVAPFTFDDEMSGELENLSEQMQQLHDQLDETESRAKPDAKKSAELNKKLRELVDEQNRLRLKNRLEADQEFKRQMRQYSEQMKQYGEEIRKYETHVQKYERDIRKSIPDQDHVFNDLRLSERQMKIESERMHTEAQRQQESANRNHEKAMANHEKALELHEKAMKSHEKSLRDMKLISAELHKDGLAREGRRFEFKINGSEMLIDGKKQPLSVYEKYQKLVENGLEQKVKLNELKDGQWFSIESDGKGGSSMRTEFLHSQKTSAKQTHKESTLRKSTLFVEFYKFDPLTKKKPSGDGC